MAHLHPSCNLIQLLQIVNPDTNGYTCVGQARSYKPVRRCRNPIAASNLAKATQLLQAIPSAAGNASALHDILRSIADLTLCRRWHVKDPSQHDAVISKWKQAIEQGSIVSVRISCPASRTQSQQNLRETDRCGRQPESTRSPSYRRNVCTICLDPVGTNGGRSMLPCKHEFCSECIASWERECIAHRKREHYTCPLCRHKTSQSKGDSTGPLRNGGSGDNVGRRSESARDSHLESERQNSALRPIEEQSSRIRHGQANRHWTLHDRVSFQEYDNNREQASGTGIRVETPQASSNEDDGAVCAICLEELGVHGDRHTLNCSHSFCSECIGRWHRQSQRKSCPYRCPARAVE